MNKIKIFFGTASMVLAIAAVAATKVGAVAPPEYYVNDAGICAVAPQPTECGTGLNACTILVTGQIGAKQVFDVRSNSQCSVPLSKP